MSGSGATHSAMRRRGRAKSLALLAFVFVGSCFPGLVGWRAASLRAVPDLEQFTTPTPVHVRETQETEEGRTVVRLVFPVDPSLPGPRGELNVYLYRPEGVPPHPTLLVLPTLGGRYRLSKFLAGHFAEGGRLVVRLERRGALIDSRAGITAARHALQGAVIDARLVLDWLAQHSLSDPQRTAIMGVSAGAILAALVAGIDERISAAAFILGGGNLAEITLEARGSGLARLRDGVAKMRPAIWGSLEAHLHDLLDDVDPLSYAGRLPPERLLMINGLFDVVVPRRCYLALWEAWGEPRLLELPAGHFTSLPFLPLVLHYLDEHFERWLGP
ncbi:MAG: alpha/beta hydrolase [Planctomycetota bacterium]